MFQKKGVITLKRGDLSEDDVLSMALEAGAEDLQAEEDSFEVTAAPEDFDEVKKTLVERNIKIENAEITMHPKSTVQVDEKNAETLLKLMDALEDQEDVQNLYSNFDIDTRILESMENQD
jgi:transcriptional/translational regulatory protein YebC/TACO1